jgi:hypothetical protein
MSADESTPLTDEEIRQITSFMIWNKPKELIRTEEGAVFVYKRGEYFTVSIQDLPRIFESLALSQNRSAIRLLTIEAISRYLFTETEYYLTLG